MTRTAMIHSKNSTDEVRVIQCKDVNHVIVEYNGKHYTAVDNPFSGLIYCDDIYGEVSKDFRF